MNDKELIELLKHFRDDFERIVRCYLNPNVEEDEYALDDGKDLVEIAEEAVKELTTLIGGSVLDLNGKLYEIGDIVDDKKSNFEKALDKVVAKHLNEDVAEMMGAAYEFQPAILPKDEKKHEE